MPARVRRWVGIFSKSMPSNSARPLALSSPMIAFISVVLPAPLRPIRPIIAPLGTSSDTPRRICVAAIDTLRFSTLSTLAHDVALHLGILERGLRRGIGDDPAVV